MIRSLVLISASVFALGPCTKKDDASDASATASATAAATTAEAPRPPPPADAAKSCSATPIKIVEQNGNQELEYTLKNSGTKPWHYCQVNVWAWDKVTGGTVIGHGGMSENIPLAPGATQTSHIPIRDSKDKPLAGAATAFYEVIPSDITFDDRSQWNDPSIHLYDHPKSIITPVALGGAAPAAAATGAATAAATGAAKTAAPSAKPAPTPAPSASAKPKPH